MRDDGEGDHKWWVPKEAVHAHSELKYANKRREDKIFRVNAQGNEVVPKGDIVYCEKHDEYYHQGDACFSCLMEQ